MLTMDIANYVLLLDDAVDRTTNKDDQSLYLMFRAHSGYVLALAVAEADAEKLDEALNAHDALWTTTMLIDDAYKDPAEAWQKLRGNAD